MHYSLIIKKMLQNYLKIAIRSLLRNKVYSLINVLGLAVGVAACLLIFLIVNFELSYDTFHSQYQRIYRVVTEDKLRDGNFGRNPGAPIPVTEALRLDMPALKVAAINASYGSQITVLGKNKNEISINKKFIEPIGIMFMGSQFFEIFDAKWLIGNPKASLTTPNQVVLSKAQAEKYFGNWKNAEGQFLKMDNLLTLQVKGIIEDMPENSDFPLKVLVSFETFKKAGNLYGYTTEWGSTSSNHQVFALLPENQPIAKFQAQMPKFIQKHYNKKSSRRNHIFHPLSENHFDAEYGNLGNHQTNRATLWTLSLIGFLVLVMACINFINLATAQAVSRAREVGVRKVLGGYRIQLLAQFMIETAFVVALAVSLSLVIVELTLPFVRQVSNVPENIAFLQNPKILLFIPLITLTVSFLSGIYPALILSGFDPVQALKNKITTRKIGNVSLRRSLVVVQFSISQVLIVGTLVAVGQMDFIRKIDLGFSKDAVYMTSISADSLSIPKFKAFKNEISQINGVKSASLASDPPSSDNNSASNFAFDRQSKDADFPIFMKKGDADYFQTYGLQIIAGRTYSPSDTTREYVVNETLLKKMGVKNPQDAIGKMLKIGGGQWKPIVGIVKDFKANSVREGMKPIAIMPEKSQYYRFGVKIQPSNLQKTTAEIQKVWEKYFPDYVYEGYFLDERIAQFYLQENQLATVYKIFAGLAIFISCLGLYGLISFLTMQKTKEIGIRKVLGASIPNLVLLLTKDFLILVSISILIASPIAWYLMNQWLQGFVYRVELSWLTFVLAGVLATSVAVLTIAYQAIKASLANPIKSLRYE